MNYMYERFVKQLKVYCKQIRYTILELRTFISSILIIQFREKNTITFYFEIDEYNTMQLQIHLQQ